MNNNLNKDNLKNCENETDLYELWQILKKHIILILSIVILSTLIGITYILFTPKVFTANNFLVLPTIKNINNNTTVSTGGLKKFLNHLSYLSKHRKQYFQNKLKLNKHEIKALKDIEILDSKKGNLINIRINLFDLSCAKSIFNKIADYLNDQYIIRESFKIRKSLLEQEKEVLNNKIKEYKTFINMLKSINHQKNDIYLGFDPLSSLLSVERRYLIVSEELKIYNKFWKATYVSSPILPNKPVWPKIKLILAIIICFSLLFGIALSFILEWIKTLREKHINLEQ